MKIAVFGNNCMSHFLAQKFMKEGVEKTYLFGVNSVIQSNSNIECIPFSKEKSIQEFYLDQATQLSNRGVEFVINTTLVFQMWKTFYNLIEQTNIPHLIPHPETGFLEWSKQRAKALLARLNIPTPSSKLLKIDEVLENFWTYRRPFVLKYDQDYKEGLQTIVVSNQTAELVYNTLVSSGKQRTSKYLAKTDHEYIIKEDFVEGVEYSYHAISNGKTVSFLGAARDYKKLLNGDRGINTAGMGAYSPALSVDHTVLEYGQRIVDYFNQIGTPYVGILYLGVIVTHLGPMILEVNTRFGDPEFQTIANTISSPVHQLLYQAAIKQQVSCTTHSGSSVAVRFARKDYGSTTPFTHTLTINNLPTDITAAYANGFSNFNLILSTSGETVLSASNRLYSVIDQLTIPDTYTYRTDIGKFL